LSEDYIMPTMDEVDVFPREAAAVAMKAIEQGVAKFTDVTFEQEYLTAKHIIMRARGMVQDAMATGYIAMPPGSQAPRPTEMAMQAVAAAGGTSLHE
jgi:malate dehydrogenase (oxaloacetate-decarboxylating)